MASRHFSLQMGDVADVTDLLLGFERQNSVQLEIRIGLVNRDTNADIAVTMLATEAVQEIGEATPLASVSVRCLGTGLKNLRDVVTHALYALDFRLALNEFESAEKKKA